MRGWARLFDGSHVVVYRARQAWTLVAAVAIICLGTFGGWLPVLWVGSVVLGGGATAGANLGWNLGHNDFASLGKVQQYMGVNVTLTGVRGAIAPPVGVLPIRRSSAMHAGAGRYCSDPANRDDPAGAIGFNRMKCARTGT